MKSFKVSAMTFCVGVQVVIMMIAMNGCLAQDTAAYLDPHNSAQAEVGVGALQWDNTVAAYAQSYANQRAGDCQLRHSGGPYGENLFWGGAGGNWQPADAVASWVNERQYYDYNSNTCASGKVCGHYTQVVWRNTQRLGCASVNCDNNGGTFISCSYDPAGNVDGQKTY